MSEFAHDNSGIQFLDFVVYDQFDHRLHDQAQVVLGVHSTPLIHKIRISYLLYYLHKDDFSIWTFEILGDYRSRCFQLYRPFYGYEPAYSRPSGYSTQVSELFSWKLRIVFLMLLMLRTSSLRYLLFQWIQSQLLPFCPLIVSIR
jgi:hypothetical protein